MEGHKDGERAGALQCGKTSAGLAHPGGGSREPEQQPSIPVEFIGMRYPGSPSDAWQEDKVQ